MFKYIFSIFICFVLNLNAKESPPSWIQSCINESFKPYHQKKFTREDFEKIISDNKGIFLCSIKNKQIKFYGNFNSILGEEEVKKRLRCVLWALKYLNSEKHLSNLCFLLSVEDAFNHDLPVLTFAKDKHSRSFCIPDFEALRGYSALDAQVAEGIKKYPFESKIDKAFWRGSTTGGIFSLTNWRNFARSRLVALSLEYPQLLDAKFSLLLQAEPKEAFELKQIMTKERMFGKATDIQEHLNYKYLVDVDGNSCTYSRLYWILQSNSLCLKQVSPQMQWYYPMLQAYEHYIPLAYNCSDLIEKIDWAQTHPEEVQKIITQANAFSKAHLRHHDALMYLYFVLENYRNLIDYRSFLKRP